MQDKIQEMVAFLLKTMGAILVVLGFVGLCVAIAAHFILDPRNIPNEAASIRVDSIVFMGKGCLMIIFSTVVDGTFKWRKDD